MRSLAMLIPIAAAASSSGQSTTPAASRDPQLAAAESFIDAFYSFDQARLRKAMADAPGSRPDLLYFQGWAEGHLPVEIVS